MGRNKPQGRKKQSGGSGQRASVSRGNQVSQHDPQISGGLHGASSSPVLPEGPSSSVQASNSFKSAFTAWTVVWAVASVILACGIGAAFASGTKRLANLLDCLAVAAVGIKAWTCEPFNSSNMRRAALAGASVLVCCLFLLFNYYVQQSASNNEVLRKLDEIKDALVLQPSSSGPESLPGFSIHALLNIKQRKEAQREYLFDYGDSDAPRFTGYLSPANTFVVSVVDLRGEQHTLNVPVGGKDGLPFDQFVYLSCGIGKAENHSVLTVTVDARELGRLERF